MLGQEGRRGTYPFLGGARARLWANSRAKLVGEMDGRYELGKNRDY